MRASRLCASILFVGIFLSLAAFPVVQAVAAPAGLVPVCGDDEFKDKSTCKDVSEDQSTTNKFYGPDGALTKIAGLITWIGGVAAVIMIILGAFTFITGSGDPNTLAAAKKTILYAVVGLVVLVLPSAIIRFVISKL